MIAMYRSAFIVLALVSLLAVPVGAQTSPGSAGSSGAKGAATPGKNSGSGSTAPAQFKTAAEAKSHCPSDTVVWANTSSKVYHFSGSKDYGTTKSGAYMCEKETAAAGFRAAQNEQHP